MGAAQLLERLCLVLTKHHRHYGRRVVTEILAGHYTYHPTVVVPLTETEILRTPLPSGEVEVQTLKLGVEPKGLLPKLVLFRFKDRGVPGDVWQPRTRCSTVKYPTVEEVLRLYTVDYLLAEAERFVRAVQERTRLKLEDHRHTMRMLDALKYPPVRLHAQETD